MDGLIRHNCQFEGDKFWDAQSVKALYHWLSRYPGDWRRETKKKNAGNGERAGVQERGMWVFFPSLLGGRSLSPKAPTRC